MPTTQSTPASVPDQPSVAQALAELPANGTHPESIEELSAKLELATTQINAATEALQRALVARDAAEQIAADRGWKATVKPSELAAPFKQIKYRPGATTQRRQNGKYPEGTMAMKLPYIDARDGAERLDQVFGPARWQDTYRVVDPEHNAVECGIGVQMADGSWVWKYDVGYPNSNSDERHDADDESLKGAYSDSFKRALAKWGIGRHLYRMKRRWGALKPNGQWADDTSEEGAQDSTA